MRKVLANPEHAVAQIARNQHGVITTERVFDREAVEEPGLVLEALIPLL